MTPFVTSMKAGLGRSGRGPSRYAGSQTEGYMPASRERQVVEVRPFQESHLEQVYHLYDQVFGQYGKSFGEDWTAAFRSRWRWLHHLNLYSLNSPKWVLVSGQRLVGFLATIPLPYRINGCAVVAHTPCDYMVHPDHRFHGIKLMQEFFRSCENCVTCDDVPATIKVTRWLGAQPVGKLIRYVKILDGRALRGRQGWSQVPAPVLAMITSGLRWSDRVRLVEVVDKGEVKAVDGFDDRFGLFFNKLSRTVSATVEKDIRFLDWRYGKNSPQPGCQIGVIAGDQGELKGYVVVYHSRSHNRIGYILDLQVLPPGDTKTTSSLLNYAIETLRQAGAWMVRYHQLPSRFAPSSELLLKYGFVPRGGHQLLVRFKDQAMNDTAAISDSWRLSFGDSEASYAVI